jgi:hypothetical protein
MADSLTFEYDKKADSLKVAGVEYTKGSFRGLGGGLQSGSGLVLEARGGGVFHVTVPHFDASAPPPVPSLVGEKGPEILGPQSKLGATKP